MLLRKELARLIYYLTSNHVSKRNRTRDRKDKVVGKREKRYGRMKGKQGNERTRD